MLKSELLLKWKGNHSYTRKLIEAMPEEAWNEKPAEGMKTFLSQCAHITTWLRTHGRFVTGVEMPKPSVRTREDILLHFDEFFEGISAYLKAATEEELNEIVPVFYGKRTRTFVLAVMDNHLAHHRGQMIVYLRLAGVKPPGYRGW